MKQGDIFEAFGGYLLYMGDKVYVAHRSEPLLALEVHLGKWSVATDPITLESNSMLRHKKASYNIGKRMLARFERALAGTDIRYFGPCFLEEEDADRTYERQLCRIKNISSHIKRIKMGKTPIKNGDVLRFKQCSILYYEKTAFVLHNQEPVLGCELRLRRGLTIDLCGVELEPDSELYSCKPVSNIGRKSLERLETVLSGKQVSDSMLGPRSKKPFSLQCLRIKAMEEVRRWIKERF